MNAILEKLSANPKLIVSAVLPAAILIVLVLATGTGGLFGGGSTTASSNQTSPPPPAVSQGAVQGTISVATSHLSGHRWKFTYTINDTGKTPIGGFQINGPAANLYGVTSLPGWATFGAGVCHGTFPNMLVYWSTGPGSPTEIKPGSRTVLSFDVNTTGTAQRLYSLSWGQARAQFGTVTGPASSSLPASGACKG